MLFATAGMMLLAIAADLIVVFLALELMSLSLYVLAGLFKRELISGEASMKYFLLGAFASSLMLYGIALVYGATGATNLDRIAAAAGRGETEITHSGLSGPLSLLEPEPVQRIDDEKKILVNARGVFSPGKELLIRSGRSCRPVFLDFGNTPRPRAAQGKGS